MATIEFKVPKDFAALTLMKRDGPSPESDIELFNYHRSGIGGIRR